MPPNRPENPIDVAIAMQSDCWHRLQRSMCSPRRWQWLFLAHIRVAAKGPASRTHRECFCTEEGASHVLASRMETMPSDGVGVASLRDRGWTGRDAPADSPSVGTVWPSCGRMLLVLTNPVLDQGASGGIDRAEEPKLDVCSARVSGLPDAMARACPRLCAVVSFSTWLAWTSTSGCSSARPATDTKDHRLGQGP